MPSLQEALRAAQLVSERDAQTAEQKKRTELAAEEKQREIHAVVRSSHDEEKLRRQERFMRGASRETTQSSSRVGTKQYLDRFKK
jgi:hypothetical protein